MMNMNKVNSLKDQIERADLIRVDDGPYLDSKSFSDSMGLSDNEVLYCKWSDDEGLEYSVIFTEGGLDGAQVDGNRITLEDHEGQPSIIELFSVTNRRVDWNW